MLHEDHMQNELLDDHADFDHEGSLGNESEHGYNEIGDDVHADIFSDDDDLADRQLVRQKLAKREEERLKNIEARKEREKLARMMQNDLLFAVQGVGQIKQVDGKKFFMKHQHCEESLRDLHRRIKMDSKFDPIVRVSLGDWNFLEQNLLPLLTYHKKDKKLAFLTCMLMVQLTEYPQVSEQLQVADDSKKWSWTHANSPYRNQMLEILRNYKQAFVNGEVLTTLVEHLADCLQEENKTEKHNQMIELIVVLFKHLLQIPDAHSTEQHSRHINAKLQRDLLVMYSRESVLDSINFLSQEFETDLQQRLALHILEIQHQIFKNFTPEEIYLDDEAIQNTRKQLYEHYDEEARRRAFLQRTRSWKQGIQLGVRRVDGSQAIVSNIYQKSFDVSNLGKHQRQRAAKTRQMAQKKIEVSEQIVKVTCLEASDKELLQALRGYLDDILENTYNGLTSEIFSQIVKQQAQSYEHRDNYHFFKLASFMIQVLRHRAYEAFKLSKKQALDQSKEAKSDSVNALFNQSKKGQGRELGASVKKAAVQVPFRIRIDHIGSSLQLQSLDFLYHQLWQKVIQKPNKNKGAVVSDQEFHAGLQNLTQLLYIIRDMASSDDEKNKKNARILQTNVFHKDLISVACYAYKMYDARNHSNQFLYDTVEFTHIMLSMLDEFSRGRVLTIYTNKVRTRKVKVNAAQHAGYDEEEGIDMEGEVEEEEYLEEEKIERKFNFAAELASFVDYKIVERYMSLIKDCDVHFAKRPILLKACTSFLKRIATQAKQPWIFFQLQTLATINDFLQRDVNKNHLMDGISVSGSTRGMDKKCAKVEILELKSTLKQISACFLKMLQKNKMLAVEILFEFPSREIKDAILSNYDGFTASALPEVQAQKEGAISANSFGLQMNEADEAILFKGPKQQQQANFDEQCDDEMEPEELELIKSRKDSDGSGKWTEQLDLVLIENYKDFIDLGTRQCFEILGSLVNMSAKLCHKRAKLLSLVDGQDTDLEKCKKISSEMNADKGKKDKRRYIGAIFKRMLYGLVKGNKLTETTFQQVEAKLDLVANMFGEFTEWRQDAEMMKLAGEQSQLSLDDVKMIDSYREQKTHESEQQQVAAKTNEESVEFVFVPISRNEFEMLACPSFKRFLRSMDIAVDMKNGNAFPRLSLAKFNQESHMRDIVQNLSDHFANLRLKSDGSEFELSDTLDLETIKQLEVTQ